MAARASFAFGLGYTVRAMTANRRELFAALVAAAAARGLRAQEGPVTIAGKRPMIAHNDRPEDLETPVAYLDTWVTPVDSFFVRQHIPRPAAIDPAAHRVQISGLVSKQLQLSVADLQKLPQHTVPATLECTGNGRGFYTPKVPGIQWGRGGVGNAEWSGPRLSDVLKLAGVDPKAKHIEIDGADTGMMKTPDFIRSMPMEKAMHPATLLALKMNGETPQIHGFPVRLIVPGWDGTSWVKWVTRISPTAEMTNGFFMNPGYRYPKYARPPGMAAVPAELEVIEGMPVKSSLTAPEDGAKIGMGAFTIKGFAWAGENAIERVEVSTDGGSKWQAAQLSKEKLPFAWRLFNLSWTPPQPGYYTIMSRATDTAGRVQPIVPAWNPSGYLWNGIDRVGVTVEKA
jgi:DMSO/TMAO reductase YedYZ molybdopterin-dependent catalytic subunit